MMESLTTVRRSQVGNLSHNRLLGPKTRNQGNVMMMIVVNVATEQQVPTSIETG